MSNKSKLDIKDQLKKKAPASNFTFNLEKEESARTQERSIDKLFEPKTHTETGRYSFNYARDRHRHLKTIAAAEEVKLNDIIEYALDQFMEQYEEYKREQGNQ